MMGGEKAVISPEKQRPRSRLPQSELGSFLAPLIAGITGVWRRFHFVTLGALGLYAVSGITIIEANEVGVVLRLGEVIRSNGSPITHPPGIVLALPKPFDEVLTVEVDRIDTITVNELAPPSWTTSTDVASVAANALDSKDLTLAPLNLAETIDPEAYGYVLTADRNILHTQIIVRYRVRDPVESKLLTTSSTGFLRSALLQSTVKTAGETRLDDLLGHGREQFTRAVSVDAQTRLDQLGAGLEIVSLEFENLSPPEQVAADFDAVQSAYIVAQTRTQEAHSYAATVVPTAKADAREIIVQAEKSARVLVTTARADAKAFTALLHAYRASPEIVRQRLYREGLESALDQTARVKLVPAPSANGYRGTRFSILTHPRGQSAESLTTDGHDAETSKSISSSPEAMSLLSVFPIETEGGAP